MILKEKEFAEFIAAALEKSLPAGGDEKLFPRVTVLQIKCGTGFSITAEVNGVNASLGSMRNECRRFASIDSAAAFLKKIRVVSFRVVNLG
jgi:hypothetical protein